MRTEPFTRQCNFCLEYLIPDNHRFYTCICCGTDLCPPKVSPRPYQQGLGPIPCHYCGQPMKPIDGGAWECPACKSQLYGPEKDNATRFNRSIIACARNGEISNPIIKRAGYGGGGSKNKGGSRKKQLMQKSSRAALYNRLCSEGPTREGYHE